MNSVKCICCEKLIERLYPDHGVDAQKPWQGMWSNGIVDRIEAGYGSLVDGDMFIIAICDTCIDRKAKEGIAIWAGNYMMRSMESYIGLDGGKDNAAQDNKTRMEL